MEPPVSDPRESVTSPAATARSGAARGPAGHALGVPGVVGAMEGGGLGGRAERELVHVGLAHGRGPGGEHARHAGGRERGVVVLEHPGRTGRVRTHEMHVVLEGNGHAREGPEPLASRARRVGRSGGGERKVGGDLEEGLHGDVAPVDGIERGASDLRRGEVSGGNARGNLGRGEGVEVCHYRSPPSVPRIDGTRK